MHSNPFTTLLVLIPFFVFIVFFIIKNRQQPDMTPLFFKAFIYLLAAITFINAIFLIRTFIGWN